MKVIAYPAFKTKYKNPYNWLLYTNILKQGITVEEFSPKKLLLEKYDIFHLHWVVETIVRHPNPLIVWMRAIIMLMLIDWAKTRGTRIIWTIHDENPHYILHIRIANWFQKEFIKRVDGYISLSIVGKNIAEKNLEHLRNKPCCIIPAGHYRDFYPNQITRNQAKNSLNLPEKYRIMLFFGYIDVYKNVPHLIKIFRQLANPDWLLIVAGKIERPHLEKEILSATENDARIKLYLKYVPDDQVQLYFKAAELVVLPFKEILNSGSALLALSFDCPLLAPHLGSMPELHSLVGEDWMKLYTGELTQENLQQGLIWSIEQPGSQSPPIDQLDWYTLSKKNVEFYRLIRKLF